MDRYLAKTGVDAQQTDQPLDPAGHDNLFEPIQEDRGAHGPFDDQAQSFSLQYELTKRRNAVLAGAGAAVLGAAGALVATRHGK